MDYKKVNDYEVMYMIRECDDDAKDLLFKKYSPVINKFASKYLEFAKKHGVEFEDLVQEGYIALEQSIASYDDQCGVLFYSYVSLCIERHMITYCRNMSSGKNYILNNSLNEDFLLDASDKFNDPENVLLTKLAEEQFVYFKNSLDIEYSSILELRYNGFSYKEISKLLDVPISTIDGRIYRMRKKMKFINNFC